MNRTIVWGNCGFFGVNEIYFQIEGTLSTCCSDVNTAGVYMDGTATATYDATTIFTDPGFCAPIPCAAPPLFAGSFSLQETSPCLASNSPCGYLIGAPGPVCSTVGAPEGRDRGAPKLLIQPNPSRGDVWILLDAPRPGAGLSIFDTSGRLLRDLTVGDETAIRWDGTTAGGGRFAAGLYFVRLRLASGPVVRRLVRLD